MRTGWLALLLTLAAVSADAMEPIVCPRKPDPPPVIDGDMREWLRLPGGIEVTGDHVNYGKAKWRGPEDLSGSVQFCWDENYLYLLTDIVDDTIRVTQTGRDLFRTDHIEVDIDIHWTPEANGPYGDGQFLIGISPGSMEETGDPMLDTGPEYFIYHPIGFDGEGIDAAAAPTEEGYVIEARIPWKLLGIKERLEVGRLLGVDVHLSDSDNADDQEKMSALRIEPWNRRRREILVPLRLCDPHGNF